MTDKDSVHGASEHNGKVNSTSMAGHSINAREEEQLLSSVSNSEMLSSHNTQLPPEYGQSQLVNSIDVYSIQDLGRKIITAPVVSGFTKEDEHPDPSVSTSTTYNPIPSDQSISIGYEQSFARPSDPSSIHTPADLPTRVDIPAVDPVLLEAFSPLPYESGGLQPDPLMRLGNVPSQPVDDPWSDPHSTTQLGEPAKKPIQTWEPKYLTGRKLGVRELLFGRFVSRKALAAIALFVLILTAIGGYIGRITGLTQVKLLSSYATLSTDPGTPSEDKVEQVANNQSWTVVQVIASFSTGASFGSGVVVSPDGYIWTNNHVIADVATEKHPDIKVVFKDKTRADAHLVGRDLKTDVAVLKVEVKNLKVAILGDSDKLRLGQRVVAIGAPLAQDQSVTTGIVSHLHRPWMGTKDMPMADDCIQTDATINEGNSGGALFDIDGRLIGITNGQESINGAGSIGVNFAIAINQFRKVAESIIRTGKAEHPWLGISAESVTRDSGSGAKIANIADNSPASVAGLKESDVIIKVNDTDIAYAPDFVLAEVLLPIGQPATVEFLRDGRVQKTVLVPVVEKP